MKHLTVALAFLLLAGGDPRAEMGAGGCPDDDAVMSAAGDIEVQEIVPLRSRSGHRFLMLVLQGGSGLVLARGLNGCFDTVLSVSKETVEELLTQSQVA